jgi:enamine deaminase RidA (YjgF/YER057c/UK114 family)
MPGSILLARQRQHGSPDVPYPELIGTSMEIPTGRPSGAVAVVSPIWADFYKDSRIPAATRTGDTIHVSGHTCETIDHQFAADPAQQIRDTFQNIASTLAEAGASWADVVDITSYHVGLRDQAGVTLEIAAEFLGDPFPSWTACGVTELFDPEAVIEISCVAVVGPDRPAAGRNRASA